jgi:hypothetical protein
MAKDVFVNVPAEEDATAARWKALYQSMCKANDALTARVQELESNLSVLQAQRDGQTIAQASMETTVQKEFTRFNARINSLLEENNELRAKVKALKNGD